MPAQGGAVTGRELTFRGGKRETIRQWLGSRRVASRKGQPKRGTLKLSVNASTGRKVAAFATAGTIGVLVLSASINIIEAQGLVDRQLAKALSEAELSFSAKVE